jgi:protein-S-isoprenylcysteine O-methyltransferase Ste14
LRDLISRIRVPLGFVLAFFYFLYCLPTLKSLAWGSTIALIGVGIRAWASGHLHKNERLATSGPYAYTRNPLYFGSFIIGLGFCAVTRSYTVAALYVILFAVLYIPIMQKEAEHLRTVFGNDYLQYEAGVPLFFPRLKPSTRSTAPFTIQQYFTNKEYNALVGYLGALALLFLKMKLF